ncbi:MAG TPA: acetoacetate--CoA ligase [Steroidobacteraceae bacterium]|nr:acetoacetate--CoA ligase [Steroidobacteraceae bacterium]
MNSPVEGTLVWRPSAERIRCARLTDYQSWLARERGSGRIDYNTLWRWSVSDPAAFWASIWKYFDVRSARPYRQVLGGTMTAPEWFVGCELNYAEHLLDHENRASADEPALLHLGEDNAVRAMPWCELGSQVRKLATELRRLGIRPGDRIVSYMPNVPQTVVAMMACVAVGGVWSSASPEFGSRTVIDRFGQIEPTLMFAAPTYGFGGRVFDRTEEVRRIAGSLPTLKHLVWLAEPAAGPGSGPLTWNALMSGPEVSPADFEFTRVQWNHPLWILFSSGTTGLPKAIVHGHAGMLLEHLKLVHLHLDLRPGARLFFHTTTGWMMWNIVVAALLAGATAVLYEGSPLHPAPDALWRIAAEVRATHMGASPTFIAAQKNAGIRPKDRYDLSDLEMITLSGSPCSPELFAWILAEVKADVWIASQSGGTEICSAFVGAIPTLPVYAGEIQGPLLGMDVHAWGPDGSELVDTVGELVVCKPFPSMPVCFWNDEHDQRYLDSYFRQFPGVWCHGDFIRINSRGGCYIQGRSDATLNRHGVRIGTAEIYRIVEQVPGVADSLAVCCERADGSLFMPLFVKLDPGVSFSPALRQAICDRLRRDGSPRHVPDAVQPVRAIPYTLTGKKMEIPVRRILGGASIESAASRDAMADPGALDEYPDYRKLI